MSESPTYYLIWSNENRRWLGPGGNGYVRHLTEAGRYSRERAIEICRKALLGQWKPGYPFPEMAILERDVLALTARQSPTPPGEGAGV